MGARQRAEGQDRLHRRQQQQPRDAAASRHGPDFAVPVDVLHRRVG
jgi:hypothetical protein